MARQRCGVVRCGAVWCDSACILKCAVRCGATPAEQQQWSGEVRCGATNPCSKDGYFELNPTTGPG